MKNKYNQSTKTANEITIDVAKRLCEDRAVGWQVHRDARKYGDRPYVVKRHYSK